VERRREGVREWGRKEVYDEREEEDGDDICIEVEEGINNTEGRER